MANSATEFSRNVSRSTAKESAAVFEPLLRRELDHTGFIYLLIKRMTELIFPLKNMKR